MPGELCNYDLAHDLHIDFFFKVRFQLVVYYELLVKLMQSKKRRESVRHWAHCITLPYHHTHELDL